MQLSELVSWLKSQLGGVVVSPAQLNAECNWLLDHFLNVSLEIQHVESDRDVACDSRYQALVEAVNKRVNERIPLQYVLGEAWFYGEAFHVSPDVLIPRPETELIVERVLLAHTIEKATVLDLATGSGCIAVTLKKHMPSWRITATDISEAALDVARINATRHNAEIRFLHGNWLAPLHGETFDVIVCNPPYIARADQLTLTPEVLCEPEAALFSPETPEMLYQYLFENTRNHLNPGGVAWFELGMGQAEWANPLAEAMGYHVTLLKDYQGIDRAIGLICLPR